MKTIEFTPQTASLIVDELAGIPEKYRKPFNSAHEGLSIIQEEFEELKSDVYFGEKDIQRNGLSSKELRIAKELYPEITDSNCFDHVPKLHKLRMRQEAIQVAAMCIRFIQEVC